MLTQLLLRSWCCWNKQVPREMRESRGRRGPHPLNTNIIVVQTGCLKAAFSSVGDILLVERLLWTVMIMCQQKFFFLNPPIDNAAFASYFGIRWSSAHEFHYSISTNRRPFSAASLPISSLFVSSAIKYICLQSDTKHRQLPQRKRYQSLPEDIIMKTCFISSLWSFLWLKSFERNGMPPPIHITVLWVKRDSVKPSLMLCCKEQNGEEKGK